MEAEWYMRCTGRWVPRDDLERALRVMHAHRHVDRRPEPGSSSSPQLNTAAEEGVVGHERLVGQLDGL